MIRCGPSNVNGILILKLLHLKSNIGKLRSKKVKLKRKSVKNEKERAITDLNAPNDSRDIPFQSHKFEQDERRHFVGFQSHFH